MRPQVLFSRLNFWIQTVHGDHTQILWQKSWYSKSFDGTGLVMELYDMLEQRTEGDPIWVNTLSNHCRGPFRWSSIQQGVLVTVCLRYSAPHPFTKLILMVHILVSWYTASKPWFTDWARRAANSWLLKIFRLQPGGILHTVAGCQPYLWLQLGLCTKIALSLRHSAKTSPPM